MSARAPLAAAALVLASAGVCSAQSARAVAEPKALSLLVGDVLADPKNPDTRFQLHQAVQERLLALRRQTQRLRAEALLEGLKFGSRSHVALETSMDLIAALYAVDARAVVQFSESAAKDAADPRERFQALVRESLACDDRGGGEACYDALLESLSLRAPRRDVAKSEPPPPAQVRRRRRESPAVKTPALAPPPEPARPLPAFAALPRVLTTRDRVLALKYFQEGVRFYSEDKLADAIDSFEKSLEHDPDNIRIKKSIQRSRAELKLEIEARLAPGGRP